MKCHKSTITTIPLEDITDPAVADHFMQFVDVVAKIIERVLADQDIKAKVSIPTVEEMYNEASERGLDEEYADMTTTMVVDVTETFDLSEGGKL